MSTLVSDLVVLITGGVSGIGRSTVEHFLRDGYLKIAVADRNTSLGEELLPTWRATASNEPDIIVLALDLANETSSQDVVAATVAHFGRLDVAVNCAGIGGPSKKGCEIDPRAWRAVIDVDLNGCFYFTQACCKYWLSQKARVVRDNSDIGLEPVYQRGSLVNIASAVGNLALPYQAALVAAKHGVNGISKNFALEYVNEGIRINTVSPGVIYTPIMHAEDFDLETAKGYLAQQAFKRFGSPDEVAACIVYLSSDEASFHTGTNMSIDGGWSAH